MPNRRYQSRRARQLAFRSNVALTCAFPLVLFVTTAYLSAGRWLPVMTILTIPVLVLTLIALAGYGIAARLEAGITAVQLSNRRTVNTVGTRLDLYRDTPTPTPEPAVVA